MESLAPGAWTADWLWGLPLIVLASIVHVLGLGTIEIGIDRSLRHGAPWRPRVTFVVVVGSTVLAATILHAIAAMVWAGAYLWLGALPDARSAMLYSIGAMTTFGHANIQLAGAWQMLGALEALNGMLLFGLTTAFLYATIQNVRGVILRERGTIRHG
ncbi:MULTISPECIES: hypothetical protein [unclassified Chelatococcus]|uniref:hypothetical protein n=1 Tax=unclassified Chelatococcus TaxID=2638111 RepID=UPI001BD15678|nr:MULTISPECIES: hypothetical protein [unclassified Chelatococcus]MBS7698392.1 hypothetical protein [Chelatococcus sp. YT9]MBX3558841.1 hypothetical protein [Chelatococcus sp.]